MQNVTQTNTILVNGATIGLTMGVSGVQRGLILADSLRPQHEVGKRPCPAFPHAWSAPSSKSKREAARLEAEECETTRRERSSREEGVLGSALYQGLTLNSIDAASLRHMDDSAAQPAARTDMPVTVPVCTGPAVTVIADVPVVAASAGTSSAAFAGGGTTARALSGAVAARPRTRGNTQSVANPPAAIWAALVLSRALSS